MSHASLIHRASARSLLALFLAMAPVADAAEPDVSGTFADDGSVVSRSNEGPASRVSLRALLALEFDARAAQALHDQTAEIRIAHGPAAVSVQALDAEGAVVWQGDWRMGEGCTQQGERVVLRLRSERHGRDEFLIILQAATAYRLLQVEMQRLTPTLLGPMVHPVGTYVFPRIK